MLKQPSERTVEIIRPTYFSGVVEPVGKVMTLPTGLAAELVSANKAKFVSTMPNPVPTPMPDPKELPDDHPHVVAKAHQPKKGN
jgi:hypothetical protein